MLTLKREPAIRDDARILVEVGEQEPLTLRQLWTRQSESGHVCQSGRVCIVLGLRAILNTKKSEKRSRHHFTALSAAATFAYAVAALVQKSSVTASPGVRGKIVETYAPIAGRTFGNAPAPIARSVAFFTAF